MKERGPEGGRSHEPTTSLRSVHPSGRAQVRSSGGLSRQSKDQDPKALRSLREAWDRPSHPLGFSFQGPFKLWSPGETPQALPHSPCVSAGGLGGRPMILPSVHGGPVSPLTASLPAGPGSPWEPTLQLAPSGRGSNAQRPPQENGPNLGAPGMGNAAPPPSQRQPFLLCSRAPEPPVLLGPATEPPGSGRPCLLGDRPSSPVKPLPKKQTDL